MSKSRFAEEFKEEAVKQVIECGYAVTDVAKRLGISVQSLYEWVKVYTPNATDHDEAELKEVRRENLTLKAELRRAQEERDILKKRPRISRKTRREVRVYLRGSKPVRRTVDVWVIGRCAQWG